MYDTEKEQPKELKDIVRRWVYQMELEERETGVDSCHQRIILKGVRFDFKLKGWVSYIEGSFVGACACVCV